MGRDTGGRGWWLSRPRSRDEIRLSAIAASQISLILLEALDAVAEFGGVFVLFGGDGFGELVFEFLEFGEGGVLFDFGGEFVQGVEGALAFEFEGVFLGFGEGVDVVDGGLDDEGGFLVAVVGQLEHRAGDGVDAEDVGAPLFEVVLVLFAGGVAVDEVEEGEVAGGVAEGALPVVDLEEVEVAIVVEDAFVEELDAFIGVELELGSAGLVAAGDLLIEDGIGVVRAVAIGAAFDFVLFDAEGEADLHDLAAVGEGDDADAVVRVVRPRSEMRFDVGVEFHGVAEINLPAKVNLGNCGKWVWMITWRAGDDWRRRERRRGAGRGVGRGARRRRRGRWRRRC